MRMVENQELGSMLYKKCHRDFVRQFKVGSKFKYVFSNGTETIIEVTKKPSACRWIELEVADGFFAIIDAKGRKLDVEAINNAI